MGLGVPGQPARAGDRIAVLRERSHIAQFDTPEAILTDPADDFVSGFVGAGAALKRLNLSRVRDVEITGCPTASVDDPLQQGMGVPAKYITQMDTGIIYTQAAKGSCTYGEVFTTDGRIKSMNLVVMADDRKFFPNYNAASMINTRTLKKWPAIADVLAPITAKLNNSVARTLNAKVVGEG